MLVDATLGLAFLALAGVTCARVALWNSHRRSRPLTVGMAASVTACVLGLPGVDRAIDTATAVAGANISDVANTMATMVVWWSFGVVGLRVIDRRPGRDQTECYSDQYARAVRLWTYWLLLFGVVMVAIWILGDTSSVEVDNLYTLSDPGTVAFTGLFLVVMLAAHAVLVAAAILGVRDRRSPGWQCLAMLALGVVGAVYALTVLGLVLLEPETASEHYRVFTSAYGLLGLVLLAACGLAGVRTGYRQARQSKAYATTR